MATFAALAGVKLPENDREGKPIIFDSYDMSPVLFGTGKSTAQNLVLLHRERTDARRGPRRQLQVRVQSARRRRRQDRRSRRRHQPWLEGPEKYVATVPQVFDLWQDPQERYDIFMNNYTERTWTLVTINDAIKNLMKTYVQYPPRKLQSEGYTGPITLSGYERFQFVRDVLWPKKGFKFRCRAETSRIDRERPRYLPGPLRRNAGRVKWGTSQQQIS